MYQISSVTFSDPLIYMKNKYFNQSKNPTIYLSVSCVILKENTLLPFPLHIITYFPPNSSSSPALHRSVSPASLGFPSLSLSRPHKLLLIKASAKCWNCKCKPPRALCYHYSYMVHGAALPSRSFKHFISLLIFSVAISIFYLSTNLFVCVGISQNLYRRLWCFLSLYMSISSFSDYCLLTFMLC